jgi:hypothetical protein
VAARELEPRAETGAIFGTSFGKTQHAGACCRAEVPECRPARTSRQAARPDARHHALQWLLRADAGIRRRSWRECRPEHRRYRADQIDNGWRRISSHETRHDRAVWPIGSEWAARSITPVYDGIARARFQLPLPQGPKNATNRCSGRLSGPASSQRTAGDLVLCKPERLCYTLPAREPLFRLFLGSSAVEHSTVNRMVAGSNPARGASRGFYVLRADGLNPDSAAYQHDSWSRGASPYRLSFPMQTRINRPPAAAGYTRKIRHILIQPHSAHERSRRSARPSFQAK